MANKAGNIASINKFREFVYGVPIRQNAQRLYI